MVSTRDFGSRSLGSSPDIPTKHASIETSDVVYSCRTFLVIPTMKDVAWERVLLPKWHNWQRRCFVSIGLWVRVPPSALIYARVVELVDTLVLGSNSERCVGSSPATGTKEEYV